MTTGNDEPRRKSKRNKTKVMSEGEDPNIISGGGEESKCSVGIDEMNGGGSENENIVNENFSRTSVIRTTVIAKAVHQSEPPEFPPNIDYYQEKPVDFSPRSSINNNNSNSNNAYSIIML